tara:strand:- start:6072 stop:7220 length:1149 start_codon:yes stop_codon:yes gene_type:complete
MHKKYGGSTAARTMGCPAWLRLSEEAFTLNGTSNPAADEGTLLHNCMEEYYGEGEYFPAMLQQGRSYKDQHLTQDLIDTKLLPAEEAVADLLAEFVIPHKRLLLEPMVNIDDDIGGSIDMLGLSNDGKTILVLDYKFGFVDVDVVDNKQLLFYALAAATDPVTRHLFDAVEKVVMAIVQPNNSGPDCQTWTIGMDEIDQFESKYLEAVELSESPEAMPAAGTWCKYCPAHATCPVKTGLALKATRINEINAAKLAEYLPMADQVMKWAKEVQKVAYEQLQLGTQIKGYKLVDKRASRVWSDVAAVEDKVRKAKKIKLEQGFDYKLKSPAQLEKVCKELGVDFKQYDKLISKVTTGTTLALESDKRPASLPIAGLEQLNAMNS